MAPVDIETRISQLESKQQYSENTNRKIFDEMKEVQIEMAELRTQYSSLLTLITDRFDGVHRDIANDENRILAIVKTEVIPAMKSEMMSAIDGKILPIAARVDELYNQPRKRMDTIVAAIITGAVGILVTLMFKQ